MYLFGKQEDPVFNFRFRHRVKGLTAFVSSSNMSKKGCDSLLKAQLLIGSSKHMNKSAFSSPVRIHLISDLTIHAKLFGFKEPSQCRHKETKLTFANLM